MSCYVTYFDESLTELQEEQSTLHHVEMGNALQSCRPANVGPEESLLYHLEQNHRSSPASRVLYIAPTPYPRLGLSRQNPFIDRLKLMRIPLICPVSCLLIDLRINFALLRFERVVACSSVFVPILCKRRVRLLLFLNSPCPLTDHGLLAYWPLLAAPDLENYDMFSK